MLSNSLPRKKTMREHAVPSMHCALHSNIRMVCIPYIVESYRDDSMKTATGRRAAEDFQRGDFLWFPHQAPLDVHLMAPVESGNRPKTLIDRRASRLMRLTVRTFG